MRYETDSISIEAEITSNDGHMEIIVKTRVKDPEVFPPLNLEDKRLMARVMDIVANQQQALLSMRNTQAAPRRKEIRMLPVVCDGCGEQFEVEEPCCGERQKRIECPSCGKPLFLTRKQDNA